jgi:hypothetical protein
VSVTPRPPFTPGERTPGTHCTGGWVGPRAGLDTEVRGKIIFPRRGSNPDRPVVQPVDRHYTAWANPAPEEGSVTSLNWIPLAILFSVHNMVMLDNLCCVTVEERYFFTHFWTEHDLSGLQSETTVDRNIPRAISIFGCTVWSLSFVIHFTQATWVQVVAALCSRIKICSLKCKHFLQTVFKIRFIWTNQRCDML